MTAQPSEGHRTPKGNGREPDAGAAIQTQLEDQMLVSEMLPEG